MVLFLENCVDWLGLLGAFAEWVCFESSIGVAYCTRDSRVCEGWGLSVILCWLKC